MIRIHRLPQPAVLAQKGAAALQTLLVRIQADPKLVLQSEDFLKEVYGHDTVKTALQQAQHDKCAFCEAKVKHISFGHIEHFRPKAAYKQKASDPLHRPGYYWLAYEWTNLLFSCEICNSRHKGNLFPLLNSANRVTSPKVKLKTEQPVFIDPAAEDPAPFVRFRKHLPYAVRNNRRGRLTIRSLGLNREELNEHRRERLRVWVQLWKSTRQLMKWAKTPEDARLIQDNKSVLRHAANPEAEYSAMARDYLLSVNFD